MDNRAIGIFDSGVGGLTVAKRVMEEMPNEKIIYFGDTARVPYGSKSRDTVIRYSFQITRFLTSKDVKAVIIACNTANAMSIGALRESFSLPIFGVIAPGAQAAADATKNNKIGVIGTLGTIGSRAYEDRIRERSGSAIVISKACPLFVPLAEEGWTRNEVAALAAKNYLGGLLDSGIDTLVLGCTHYPLLKDCIQGVTGDGVHLIDPAKAAAESVKGYFMKSGMFRTDKEKPCHEFYVSDYTPMFESICREALGEVFEPQVIDIESC